MMVIKNLLFIPKLRHLKLQEPQLNIESHEGKQKNFKQRNIYFRSKKKEENISRSKKWKTLGLLLKILKNIKWIPIYVGTVDI